MEIGGWTIERAFQVEYMVAAALVSGYWFYRAYRRLKNRLRYTRAQRDSIRERARRSL
jgi:hypothetical protein